MKYSIEEITEISIILYQRYKGLQVMLFKRENDLFNDFIDGYIDIAIDKATAIMKDEQTTALSSAYHGILDAQTYISDFLNRNPNYSIQVVNEKLVRLSRAVQSYELISEDIHEDSKKRLEHIKSMRDLALATANIVAGSEGIGWMNDNLPLWNQKIAESNSYKTITHINITAKWKKDLNELRKLIKAIKGMGLTSRPSDIEAIFLGKNTSFKLKEGKLLVFIGLIAELNMRECFVTYPANKHFALFEMLYIPDGPKRPKASYFRKRAFDIYNDANKFSEVQSKINKILANASLI